MSTLSGTIVGKKTLSSLIRRYPLTAYFLLAFTGTWLVISPLVLDGFGWIELSDGAGFLLFFLSTLSGPVTAAYMVTGLLDGKAGMRRLFRGTFQVRAGLQWYAVVLFAFLAVWLGAYGYLYNGAPLARLLGNPSLLITAFLPNVLAGLLLPAIGEEPGWRGFALPRLQATYGPLAGTLILGILHGIWHLPAMLTPLLGPLTVDGFITFVWTAAAGTFVYTWVFNNTRGSVWMAMVLHASSNAASQLVGGLIPQDVVLTGWMKSLESGWINVIAFSFIALLLVILTRGKLGYRSDEVTS